MEIGKFIDFHESGSTNDYDGRLHLDSGFLKWEKPGISPARIPVEHAGTGTIPTTGWTQWGDGVQYGYKYYLAVPITGVTTLDRVDVYFPGALIKTAQAFNISSGTDSYEGGFFIYSDTVPTSTIAYTYVITKG